MGELKDEGIILRVGHFHEADLWLRVLLRGSGLLTLFAFGGARSKRRFCGCLDMFNKIECRIHVSRTGEYLTLEEAGLLSGPRELRHDWRRMGYASNCLKFVEALKIGPESAGECYEIVDDMRMALESSLPDLCQYFFRLRMAAALGYAVDFSHCAECQEPLDAGGWLRIAEGSMLCGSCMSRAAWQERRLAHFLSGASVARLEDIKARLPSRWPTGLLPAREKRQCGRAIDAFVQYHLGLEWDNGFFRQV